MQHSEPSSLKATGNLGLYCSTAPPVVAFNDSAWQLALGSGKSTELALPGEYFRVRLLWRNPGLAG